MSAAEKARPISAWACSQCGAPRLDREEAAACCTCSGCGVKFKGGGSYSTWSSKCPRCSYGANLRDARAGIRRAEDALKSAKERLERILREGRPAKGAA